MKQNPSTAYGGPPPLIGEAHVGSAVPYTRIL